MMARELGLEPGSWLRNLYQQILTDELTSPPVTNPRISITA
jgi:hypothetical protein